ncbi:flagellar basal-body rod protein FlgG [Vibrio sp.]|nr:flagellar basal-body rod protein FlgG [Vibrio sp.]
MNAALWISKTGLSAQDTKMNAISNNLANVNTNGYKRDRVVFEDLFYSIQTQPGIEQNDDEALPTGVQLGNGVRVVGTEKVHTQGAILNTNQDLDLAILGNGFFQILNSDGEILYTRNGQFNVNSEGVVVNTAGLALEPEIVVPENVAGLTIGSDGTVMAIVPGSTQPENLGTIALATFMNPSGLAARGGNLFSESEASGAPNELIAGADGAGFIKQGSLEGSNVNVVEEMVEMISTQRAYEMNAKMVSAADEMLQYIARAS